MGMKKRRIFYADLKSVIRKVTYKKLFAKPNRNRRGKTFLDLNGEIFL
jgi:hypothetical protein